MKYTFFFAFPNELPKIVQGKREEEWKKSKVTNVRVNTRKVFAPWISRVFLNARAHAPLDPLDSVISPISHRGESSRSNIKLNERAKEACPTEPRPPTASLPQSRLHRFARQMKNLDFTVFSFEMKILSFFFFQFNWFWFKVKRNLWKFGFP